MNHAAMSLFIVVHHPLDPHPNWRNEWDGDLLLTITTPGKVADRLQLAAERGERVYVLSMRARWSAGGNLLLVPCESD